MIKIGIVNIDTSHPKAFASIMTNGVQMQYDMVYNDGFRGEEEVAWFANKFCNGRRANSIEELADETEVGFIQSCNWDKHIEQAMPFIERGKPVFIDKPIVGSVSDAARLEDLANSGAIILGSSSARYAKEIQDFLQTPVEERGEVLCVYGTCGVDEFNYGVHIAEIVSEIAGSEPLGCAFLGNCRKAKQNMEIFKFTFKNGVTGMYSINTSIWQPFCITIMTTKSSFTFKVDSTKIYKALLDRISEFMLSGNNTLADTKELVDCTRLMLCGKKSRDEKGGSFVSCADLTDVDGFDGQAFEKFYADAAGVIYKD